MKTAILAAAVVWALATWSNAAAQEPKLLRVGIVGTDTSHVPAFTALLNGPKATGDLAGFKVVAAFPGGSDDLPISRDRVMKFAEQIRDKHGVELVGSIEALLEKVDVVLLESVDGRVHAKQAAPILKARKPVFIDKPLTASLVDSLRIRQLALETKTPVFSCSSLRFGKKIADLKADPKLGGVLGAVTWGSNSQAEHHPELSFYGVHGLELLYAFMGPGCKSVQRTATPDADVLTGVWGDGRTATYRGIRKGKAEFGALVFGKTAIVTINPYEGYEPMVREICKFFRTGVSPVPLDESVEIMAVIDAADESRRRGGAVVELEPLYAAARAQLAK